MTILVIYKEGLPRKQYIDNVVSVDCKNNEWLIVQIKNMREDQFAFSSDSIIRLEIVI